MPVLLERHVILISPHFFGSSLDLWSETRRVVNGSLVQFLPHNGLCINSNFCASLRPRGYFPWVYIPQAVCDGHSISFHCHGQVRGLGKEVSPLVGCPHLPVSLAVTPATLRRFVVRVCFIHLYLQGLALATSCSFSPDWGRSCGDFGGWT